MTFCTKNRHHSEESKKKMSKARKGVKIKPQTEQHKENTRQARLGKKHSNSTKQKISEGMKRKASILVVCPYCNKKGGSIIMKR